MGVVNLGQHVEARPSSNMSKLSIQDPATLTNVGPSNSMDIGPALEIPSQEPRLSIDQLLDSFRDISKLS